MLNVIDIKLISGKNSFKIRAIFLGSFSFVIWVRHSLGQKPLAAYVQLPSGSLDVIATEPEYKMNKFVVNLFIHLALENLEGNL